MRLVRARFENFRLLRDLELNFSQDSERRLTVIRAANESGKTTILTALQWALYGDLALPGKSDEFRLHPIDWDEGEGARVPITVTVDFKTTSHRNSSRGVIETVRSYRIVRSTFEELKGAEWKRSPTSVQLYALTDAGDSQIDAPEAIIHDELPPELREVFFTDGDRALSFIEANVSVNTKRERVEAAIRSLLGLGVLEDAIKHVKKAAAEVNKQAKKVGQDSNLATIADRLDKLEKQEIELEEQLEDAKKQFAAFDQNVSEIDKQISEALQNGDKEKLAKDIEQTDRALKRLDAQLLAANKQHAELFRAQSLATDLLEPVVSKALSKLDELHDRGDIPNTTIPVLEDRLEAEICICGESLSSKDKDAKERIAHIQHLIDESKRADEIKEIITNLYFGAKSIQPGQDAGASEWIDEYTVVVKQRDGLQVLRDDEGRKRKSLEKQLEKVPNSDVQGLRDAKKQAAEQRDRFLEKKSSSETQLRGISREKSELVIERDKRLREQKKGALVLSELEVTRDVIKVLESSYERITTEELQKVSTLMNDLFLQMIGADPDQGAIIQRAEISQQYDILVYGPNEKMLNPDRDLNGASRRALTLAFILALTKISEVQAPNVIDTPLGMTSGYVKRSILQTARRESSQLILFLTHDEIVNCEDLLDQHAGMVFTLTNPAHYPIMLVHDPGIVERKVVRCECNHREHCRTCERRLDADSALELAS